MTEQGSIGNEGVGEVW